MKKYIIIGIVCIVVISSVIVLYTWYDYTCFRRLEIFDFKSKEDLKITIQTTNVINDLFWYKIEDPDVINNFMDYISNTEFKRVNKIVSSAKYGYIINIESGKETKTLYIYNYQLSFNGKRYINKSKEDMESYIIDMIKQ